MKVISCSPPKCGPEESENIDVRVVADEDAGREEDSSNGKELIPAGTFDENATEMRDDLYGGEKEVEANGYTDSEAGGFSLLLAPKLWFRLRRTSKL